MRVIRRQQRKTLAALMVGDLTLDYLRTMLKERRSNSRSFDPLIVCFDLANSNHNHLDYEWQSSLKGTKASQLYDQLRPLVDRKLGEWVATGALVHCAPKQSPLWLTFPDTLPHHHPEPEDGSAEIWSRR